MCSCENRLFPNHQKAYTNVYRWIGIICLLLAATCAHAQPEQRYNRFQWHSYKWRTFHTKAFHVYFPAGMDSAAAYITAELPFAIKKMKRKMTTTLFKEPHIIIYPSPAQQYESNTGLYEQERYSFPAFLQTGNRMVIAYTGDYTKLKEQLYETITRSIWDHQYKEELKDQLKGAEANNKNIPFWFKEGAIRFIAHDWTIEAEDNLRRSFQQKDFSTWEASINYQPRLSGQAFCYFLTQQYYPQAVTQTCQQLKKKNLVRSLRLITKKPMDSLSNQCLRFYQQRFAKAVLQEQNRDTTTIPQLSIPRKKGILLGLQLNPSKTAIAYTVSNNNRRTVYTYQPSTGKTYKITVYNLPPWINDYSKDPYPLVQWKTDQELVVTLPLKGKLTITSYTATGSTLQKNRLQVVDGINHIETTHGNPYILNAYRKAQSDIVAYDINREQFTPYTADRFDDGAFTTTGNGTIVFHSNRPEKELKRRDTIKLTPGLYSIQGKDIAPIVFDSTGKPNYNQWDKPVAMDNNRILATNRTAGTEKFAVIHTNQPGNYTQLANYQPLQYLPQSKEIMQYSAGKDSIRIRITPVEQWIAQNKDTIQSSPWLEDYLQTAAGQARIDSILKAAKDDNPSFLEGVLIPKNAKEKAKRKEDSLSRILSYNPKRVKPYILQLHSVYFTAKVNNDYFINRYQPYLNYQGQFKFPEIGGMVQGGFTDLLENHHINIAFRLPAGTEGSDFFFKYKNTAKKWDWSLAYFRKVESLKPDAQKEWVNEQGQPYPASTKVKTHYYELSLEYPITYYLSAGVQTAARNDRTIFLATEQYSLEFEDIESLWSINTFNLTLNKLKPTIPLLHKGYTGKILIDLFKGFSQQEPALAGLQVKGQYHLPVYKYITLVAKAQAGYSAGDNYLLYNLGGTDNNVIPKTDVGTTFPQEAPYAFQTLITPFRGHLQNKLYGNTYAVANADVYFPLFQTLVPIETPLNFINLLQPGIFADAGTANETWNKAYEPQGVLWSYGLSLRTTLANYPLRLDVAWPGTFNKKPVWYFSLNLK